MIILGILRPGWVLLLVPLVSLSAQPPNIVYIFSDDHAVQSIGAYGSRINETPHIDRIAREGVIFRQSFCANSICAPSRATVLTGQHSHVCGQRTNQDVFDGSRTTFPKLLQKAGYQTALIGKWHLKSDPTGFDHWEVLRGQGHYYNPDFLGPDDVTRVTGYATDIITDKAISWMERRDPKRPFLLMCQHKAPHRTWAPAPRHLDLYADTTIPEPPTLFDSWSGRTALLGKNEMSLARHLYWDYDLKVPDSGQPEPFDRERENPEVRRMTKEQRAAWDAAYGPRNATFLRARLQGQELIKWKYQRYVKDYLRCVAAVDESVGRLLTWLDENDLAENTLIVYASDQGFYLGEHGWFDKRWMFEESLRMPLVMRWPKGFSPRASEALVQNIDHAPTLLDAAGVSIPPSMQGKTLLPLVRADVLDEDFRNAVYYAYYEEGEHAVPRHDGIRTRDHKLMWFPGTEEWQLFDLDADPRELRSVHDDPPYAAVFRSLQTRFRELRASYDADPWPLPPAPNPDGK